LLIFTGRKPNRSIPALAAGIICVLRDDKKTLNALQDRAAVPWGHSGPTFSQLVGGHMQRIIITGAFGSGKTEIAMHFARAIAAREGRSALIDLDTVNPYFTASAHVDALTSDGVRVVSPAFANTNRDVPALGAAARAALMDRGVSAVVDLGGEAAGAVVMGSLAGALRDMKAELLLVVNVFRPFTRTVEEIVRMMEEVEAHARLRVTGFVNNANLLGQTRAAHLSEGERLLTQASALTGRPIAYHGGTAATLEECGDTLSGAPLILSLENIERAPDDPSRA
jgi:hypothetical protein